METAGCTRVRAGGLVVPRPAYAGSLVCTFGFSVQFVGGSDGTFSSIGQAGSRYGGAGGGVFLWDPLVSGLSDAEEDCAKGFQVWKKKRVKTGLPDRFRDFRLWSRFETTGLSCRVSM